MLTVEINGKKLLPLSYSFTNMQQQVIEAQKKVFDHFGLLINQEIDDVGHGQWITKTCENIINIDFDVVIFFDVDCVPLSEKLYEHILSKIDQNTICGIEQTCESNKSNGHIYAGPACLAIPKTVLEKVLKNKSRFCFTEDNISDVAQRFTYDCEELSINVNFFKVDNCLEPKWRIGKTDVFFGVGTTYDDMIYHHFLIREPWRRSDFIKKCDQITQKDKTNENENLDFFAIQYNTDKSSNTHNFAQFYENYIKHLKGRQVKVLEIGIGNETMPSLKMWASYFKQGQVYGLDIKNFKSNNSNIKTFVVDQSKEKELENFMQEHGPFDIIIDDGSHMCSHQQITLNKAFDNIKTNGIIIIEDLHTSLKTHNHGRDIDTEKTTLKIVQELSEKIYVDIYKDKTRGHDAISITSVIIPSRKPEKRF